MKETSLGNRRQCMTASNMIVKYLCSKWFLLTVIGLLPFSWGMAGALTNEEQALVNKGAIMEMYKPDEHSRHFIARIDSSTDPQTGKIHKVPKNSQSVVCFVFGMEDADAARKEGRSMAEFNYTPSQAHEFLFAQGWGKYRDRFFTRCYVQEGENAFNDAVKAQHNHRDHSSSS